MKKNFWSGRMKTILIAALVVAILAAVVLGLSSGASFFENVTGSILSPVRSAVAAIDRQFEKYYNYLFQYAKLEADNAALQSHILSMEEDIRTVEELQRENERYKALLQLSESHEDYSYVASYITSWDSSDYKSAFTIGKGKNYGLEEGMCAITENGQVVGLITEVGFNWATVTTIMDSSLEISASIASSGASRRHTGLRRNGCDDSSQRAKAPAGCAGWHYGHHFSARNLFGANRRFVHRLRHLL